MDAPWHLILWRLARNLLGIFVGTAAIVGFTFTPLSTPMRVVFASASLAILLPPNAFNGAEWLDWIGLGSSVAIPTFNYLRNRSRNQAQQTTSAVPPLTSA